MSVPNLILRPNSTAMPPSRINNNNNNNNKKQFNTKRQRYHKQDQRSKVKVEFAGEKTKS